MGPVAGSGSSRFLLISTISPKLISAPTKAPTSASSPTRFFPVVAAVGRFAGSKTPAVVGRPVPPLTAAKAALTTLAVALSCLVA